MTKPSVPSSTAALHAAHSSGVIQDLINSGVVSPYVEATDIDVEQCTVKQRSDSRNINKPGVHLLTPIILTDAEYIFDKDSVVKFECLPLADTVFDALTSIQDNHVSADVTLCIPTVTHGHWRLAILTIRNQDIYSAELWDPRANPDETAQYGKAFEVFSKMLATYTESRVKPILTSAGVQAEDNNYSCADYVVQKAYQMQGLNNAITSANNPNALRLAFVKQIVANHSGFGAEVAENLVMLPDGKIQLQQAPAYKIEHVQVKQHLKALRDAVDKTQLADFDARFARHLQAIYDANRKNAAVDEKSLVREAKKLALYDLGVFSHTAKKVEPAVQSVEQQSTATVKR